MSYAEDLQFTAERLRRNHGRYAPERCADVVRDCRPGTAARRFWIDVLRELGQEGLADELQAQESAPHFYCYECARFGGGLCAATGGVRKATDRACPGIDRAARNHAQEVLRR